MKSKKKVALVVAVTMMAVPIGIHCEESGKRVYIVNAQEETESETLEITEEKTDISEAEVAMDGTEFTYSGKEWKPIPEVWVGDTTLTQETDYTLNYENNINAGTATVTVTGIGKYRGRKILTFEILPKNLTDTDVSVDTSGVKTQYLFIGKYITPIIKLRYNDMNLNTMADFTVKYEKNFYPGTATVTLEGIDNYCGIIEKRFSIVKKPIANVTIRTGFDEKKTLYVHVNNGSYSMTKGKDYDYTVYTDAKGNITITLRGLGANYTGTKIKTINAEDNPNRPIPTTKPSIEKVSVKKAKNIKVKKIKLSWKKLSKVTGYNIRYATSKKDLKKAKVRTIKKNTVKYTTKKLKKNQKYYIQVRAYVFVNGKTYYGKWSAKKKVLITK